MAIVSKTRLKFIQKLFILKYLLAQVNWSFSLVWQSRIHVPLLKRAILSHRPICMVAMVPWSLGYKKHDFVKSIGGVYNIQDLISSPFFQLYFPHHELIAHADLVFRHLEFFFLAISGYGCRWRLFDWNWFPGGFFIAKLKIILSVKHRKWPKLEFTVYYS